MNCLVSGEKEWILIDTRQAHPHVKWARGRMYNASNDMLNMGTDWVTVDPDRVDMRVFADFAHVEFTRVTQRAGDCLFVPFSMLHQVDKTSEGLSVAASYMWLPSEGFDAEACATPEAEAIHRGGAYGGNTPRLPLAAMDSLWYFNGSGIVPQGYADPDEVR